MSRVLIVGLFFAAALALAALLTPREPDPAAQYLAMQRAQLQAETERADAARWAIFWTGAELGAGLAAAGGLLYAAFWAAESLRRRRARLDVLYLGAAPVTLADLADGRAADLQRLAVAGHYAAAIAAAQARQAVPHTYSPHLTQAPARELPAGPAAVPAPTLALPGVTDLAALLADGWRPSPERILLALGPGGQRWTVPAGELLCHIALAGATGSGKTNITRLILAQLIAAGQRVYLLDLKYTPLNVHTGELWAPIAAGTVPGRAITNPAEILAIIEDFAERELSARKARWNAGQHPGPPVFLAIEEAAVLAGLDKRLMDWLGKILRLGRELNLFAMIAVQDALISTLGGNSGTRAQWQTCYYGGGDPTTGRALLRAKGLPEPPGRGVVYLRSHATGAAPQLVRVPRVSNADLAALLDSTLARARAGAARPPEAPEAPAPVWETTEAPGGEFIDDALWREIAAGKPVASVVSASLPVVSGAEPALVVDGENLAALIPQVRTLLAQAVPFGEIVQQVWGTSGGRSYPPATKKLMAIIAHLVNSTARPEAQP